MEQSIKLIILINMFHKSIHFFKKFMISAPINLIDGLFRRYRFLCFQNLMGSDPIN